MLDGTFHGLRKASLPNGSAYDSLMSSRLDELGIFCSTKRMEHPVLATEPLAEIRQSACSNMCRNTQREKYPRIQTFSCAFGWLGWQSSQLAQVAQLQGMGCAYKMAWCWYVMPSHAANCEYVAFICIHCIIAIIPLSYNLEDSFSSIWI